jgi:drug/metabolite transporter (DMT)-like permease
VFWGLVLAFLTSVSWALGNVFIQRSGRALGGPRALVWALGLGGVVSAAAAPLIDERPDPVTTGTIVWLLVGALSGLIAYAALFYSFSRAKLSLAVPFVTCWSLVSGALSLTVFHQSVTSGQLLGAAIVLGGVVLVSIGASRGQADTANPGGAGGLKPLAAAFASGLAFGVMIPAMAQVTPALGSFGTAAAVYLFGLLLAVPISFALRVPLGLPPRAAWGEVIGAGFFETAGFVFLNAAGRLAPVAVIAPVASLAAALTVLYAAIFLRERPGSLALAGALLASLGVVVLAF